MSKYSVIQQDLFKLSILPCPRLKLEDKTKEQLLEDIVLPILRTSYRLKMSWQVFELSKTCYVEMTVPLKYTGE